MKKTKLTELLSSFSASEIKRFNIFLNSPYFNDKPRFIKLFDALAKFHPNYENDKLSEEKIFAEVFPGKAYSYTIFKNSLSDLYELAKQFLAAEELASDRLGTKNMFLRNIFRRDNIKDLIDKEINIAEQFFSNEITDQAYFEQYYSFKKNKCEYYSNIEREKLDESSDEDIESFFSMVLYHLLRYAHWFEANKIMQKTTGFREIVYQAADALYNITPANKPAAIELFYLIMQLLKTYDEKYYYEIIEILKDEDKFLNNESKRWVYQTLEPFLIKKVREGNQNFYRPQFELYKHCFETGLFDHDYAFAQGKLVMTVETAIRIKEFEWIENRINMYRNKGPKNIREDYYNINMSKVLQAKGENEKALDLLNKVNPEISLIKSLVRNMQVKIYYELGHYELAKAQIDAYRHYIAREEDFSEMYKESVYNFLKLYNKLIDIKAGTHSDGLDDFEFDVNKANNIILKQWLLDKITEIKKGAK
jgi:hypothetical protein